MFSVVCLAFCTWVFWVSGRTRITAVGVWAMAGFLFVGVAGLIIPGDLGLNRTVLLTGMLIAMGFQFSAVALASLFESPRNSSSIAMGSDTWQALMVGSIVGFAAGQLTTGIPALANLSDGLVWATPVMGALAAASSRKPWPFAIPGGMILVFIVEWGGGGRLVVLALLVSVGLVFQAVYPPRTYWLKLAALLLMAPGLLLGALIEANRLGVAHGDLSSLLNMPEGFSPWQNLDSVWSPLFTFASLLESALEGTLSMHGYYTFAVALIVWVPRALWPDKPEGWGRDLAFVFNPDAALNSRHTEASLAPAEFLWAFGILGMVFGLLALGIVVTVVHRWHCGVIHQQVPEGRASLQVLMSAITASALLTLYWTGSFSFLGRISTQLVGIALVMPVVKVANAAWSNKSSRQ